MTDYQSRIFLKFAVNQRKLVCDCYAFALRTVMRFHNVGQSRSLDHLILKEIEFLRQNEGFRQEVKVTDAMANLHARDVLVHQIFASQVEGVREVVDLLVRQQGLVYLVFYD